MESGILLLTLIHWCTTQTPNIYTSEQQADRDRAGNSVHKRMSHCDVLHEKQKEPNSPTHFLRNSSLLPQLNPRSSP